MQFSQNVTDKPDTSRHDILVSKNIKNWQFWRFPWGLVRGWKRFWPFSCPWCPVVVRWCQNRQNRQFPWGLVRGFHENVENSLFFVFFLVKFTGFAENHRSIGFARGFETKKTRKTTKKPLLLGPQKPLLLGPQKPLIFRVLKIWKKCHFWPCLLLVFGSFVFFWQKCHFLMSKKCHFLMSKKCHFLMSKKCHFFDFSDRTGPIPTGLAQYRHHQGPLCRTPGTSVGHQKPEKSSKSGNSLKYSQNPEMP